MVKCSIYLKRRVFEMHFIQGGGGATFLCFPASLTVSEKVSTAKGKDLLPEREQIIFFYTLRKHACLNILKILQPKNENFQIKNSDTFHITSQNMNCWYSLEPPQRGGSNEYPQSLFEQNKKK